MLCAQNRGQGVLHVGERLAVRALAHSDLVDAAQLDLVDAVRGEIARQVVLVAEQGEVASDLAECARLGAGQSGAVGAEELAASGLVVQL